VTQAQANTSVYLGTKAVPAAIEYCQTQQLRRFLLVCDANTHAALGQRVQAALERFEWPVCTVVLEGTDIRCDERRVSEVLSLAQGDEIVYVAVGSGTITDITRCASYSSVNRFIVLPTAPSVDAYASAGAALERGGMKVTIPCHAPAAVFADLPTLCQAPTEMIAAGFGDMLGKYTSLADWKIGAMLLDEKYDDGIAGRLARAVEACVAVIGELVSRSQRGVKVLMEALLESGWCMAQFGNSRPASGAEHTLSHFWETRLRERGRPAVLHGAKVGIGTVLAARRYDALRGLTRAEASRRVSKARRPSLASEEERIRAVYGPIADRVVDSYRPFMALVDARWRMLESTVVNRWSELQDIVASVPRAEEIAQLLEEVGAPSLPSAVGLDPDVVQEALAFSHYLRPRLTVHTLGNLLAI
jgi:glycerol-1-phosphate dehydrogenase [NAD(P)+]